MIGNTSNASISYYGNEVAWIVAFSLQFLLSIVGNVLILLIIYRDNRLKTTTNYLVANMAVSDLLAALIFFPYLLVSKNVVSRWIITGDISNAMCKLFMFSLDVCFIVSVDSCVFIAFDRYHAVAKPLERLFQSKIKWIVAGIWISTVSLSSPFLYFQSLTIINGTQAECTVSDQNRHFFKVYRYVVLLLTSGLGALIIIVMYTLTVYKLYRHKPPGLPNSALRRREQQNKKVLKMAVTVVALLYLSHGTWLTYIMLSFERKLDTLTLSSFNNIRYISTFVLNWSLMSNFFVYLIFNDIYRENVKSMICKFRCRLQRTNPSNREAISRPNITELVETNTVGIEKRCADVTG